MFQLIFLFISLFSLQSSKGTLELTVENAKNDQGIIRILVFNQSNGFPDQADKAIRMANVSVKNKVGTVKIEDLPLGTYAVAVFHDTSNTGKIRTNVLGYPVDRYGFSNNATGLLGPPSFEKAAFQLTTGKNSITISMR
ncbi:DUF2141 domain-containing protein [Mongoliitalea daihaiensis]|uniref:DUF2141 domain-containing protein n=1 Tax=Mongoliitalea daihaiensis TaxID=2782006 RepID=UPI001F29A727|nr:DUF2141 domain-containing protein [Mongoliitalea daihaiensis]UJP64586.1 DUF2141 domain-containing protein [Mongoliitalea daihaiensis]